MPHSGYSCHNIVHSQFEGGVFFPSFTNYVIYGFIFFFTRSACNIGIWIFVFITTTTTFYRETNVHGQTVKSVEDFRGCKMLKKENRK